MFIVIILIILIIIILLIILIILMMLMILIISITMYCMSPSPWIELNVRGENIMSGHGLPRYIPIITHIWTYDQVSNFLDKLANFPCPRTKIFRIFFGFQIVLYGGCDGGSCKKNQKSQCFVHFLIFLMVREWIYVDVDRPRYTFKKRLAVFPGETMQLLDLSLIHIWRCRRRG